MEWLGLPAQKWLQDPLPAAERILEWAGVAGLDAWPNIAAGPSVALVVVILYSIWASLGYSIVIYLAGLTSISPDLYEAARMDGADGWALLRLIVWPLMRPITLFLVIVNTIGSFQAFDPIFALTRNTGMGRGEAGGPLDTTLTLPVYIFRNFYERSNSVGYAAAVAFLLFFILLALTVVQFRMFGREER
jgi:multiple sugar transport system permease protein